jgi:hypothetical protein
VVDEKPPESIKPVKIRKAAYPLVWVYTFTGLTGFCFLVWLYPVDPVILSEK